MRSKTDLNVCACLVVNREEDWPVQESLLHSLENLCEQRVLVLPELLRDTVDRSPVDGVSGSETGGWNEVYYRPEEDPYNAGLLAARACATHLWLVHPQSRVLMHPMFRFTDLSTSHYVVHGFDEKELAWLRMVINVELDWRYSVVERQWVLDDGEISTDFLHQPKVQLIESDEQRRMMAAARRQLLLEQMDSGTGDALTPARIAQCLEALGEKRDAAQWYHSGAQAAEHGTSIYAYYSYHYWCLVEELGTDCSSAAWPLRWLEVYEHWSQRAEPLFKLIQYYIDAMEWHQARQLLQIALESDYPQDELPFEGWIYEYGLHYQAAQVAVACDDFEQVLVHTVATMQYHYLPVDKKQRLYEWQSDAYERLNQVLPVSREEQNHFVVIVPFRNCARFLQASIDSLKNQDYRDFEVIFFDDMSTDGGLEKCDLGGLPAYTVIHRQQRTEALGNQLDALQNYCDPSDIAVFLDGDDRLADKQVLEYLNSIYQQTGCWLTYGQFVFDDSDITGYARPMLPQESIESLFRSEGFKFPIHLRSHRAGLLHELLKIDPGLEALRRKDGQLIQRASDVAHMRAMMMLTPRERIRYISRPLYRYNTHNPGSHFQSSARREQMEESRNIGLKQELPQLECYSPFVPGQRHKTRLLVILLPGSNLDIVQGLMREQALPHIQAMTRVEDIQEFEPQKGMGNYAFLRQVMCGEQPHEYDDMARFIPRKNGYSNLGFERPHLMSGILFAERDIMEGKQYCVAGTSEVNFRAMPGLTMINQWMCHGQNTETVIYPQALHGVISEDSRFAPFAKDLERYSIADISDAEKILSKLSERMNLKLEVYRKLLERGEWDGFLTGIDELHDVGHLLWHFWDQNHPLYRADGGRIRKQIKAIYKQADAMIGELVACAGQVPAVLVGGPGMCSNGSLNTWLDQILLRLEAEYTGTAVRPGTHKRNRLFFAQYTDPSGGGIRFNLEGREPNGSLSELQYDEVCRFLIEKIQDIHNVKTERSVAKEIYVSRQHYGVSRDARFPDLLCVWEPGSAYGSIHSDVLGVIDLKPNPSNPLDFRTGDHSGVAWAVYNQQARAFHSKDAPMAPYELGEYFRRIVNHVEGERI